MSDAAMPTLTKTRILDGTWEGVLTAPGLTDAPALEVMHHGTPLDPPQITPLGAGSWRVAVAIPASLLADGVQTFVIREATGERRLTSFSIVTGQPLEDDLRAEVSLLRAELDMLKSAFRRHSRSTGG
ncbi:MAG: hypothetical protein ABNH26_03560 [Celeribacter sp.]|jgi:hypothetical protein